jgi:hypothetical protein
MMQGLTADVYSYNALLSACEKASRAAEEDYGRVLLRTAVVSIVPLASQLGTTYDPRTFL